MPPRSVSRKNDAPRSRGRKQRDDRPESPRRDDIPPDAQRGTRSAYKAAAVCGLLILAVVMAFGQAVNYGFVNFDDNRYVSENRQLRLGLSTEGIAWAFTTTQVSNWHPLTSLSFLLDYELYGPNAWGYHLSNILLHAATVVLLFLLLWRMTGELWPSALVAAVFAIHPLRAESVAWVAERKDVLSGLFFMLTVGAYVRYVRRPFSWVAYFAVIVLFALGLMAKPMLVTLPCVLLLLDYWPLGRMTASRSETASETYKIVVPWRLVVEKLPLLALSLASCVATSLAQSHTTSTLASLPLSARVANALVSYVAYVGEFFYPTGLAAFYPHPALHANSGMGWPLWQVVGAALLLVAGTAGVVAARRRYPYLIVGWFWYLGMLVPVIGLVQVGWQSMADRYTYLPQIGLTMALVWGTRDLLKSWPRRLLVASVGSALILAALLGCTWQQTTYWRDPETLWRHALDCTSDNMVAHVSLGAALREQGRFDEAIGHLREALKIHPLYVEAHTGLGSLLCSQGHLDEAASHFEAALKTNPQCVEANTGLGVLYNMRGDFDQAIAYYHRALELSPDDVLAHSNLGAVYAKQSKWDEAIREYEISLAIDPNDLLAGNNLGSALLRQGRTSEAVLQFQRILEKHPQSGETHFNLGNVWASQAKWDEALAEYRKAVELKPDYVEARYYLGLLLQDRGRTAEAIEQWDRLLQLQPNHVPTLGQLAWLLATSPQASTRNGTAAVQLAERALRLTGGKNPSALDTLAAAYAEAGRFSDAVQAAQQTLTLLSNPSNSASADAVRARLKLYQSGSAYRDLRKTTTQPERP